MSTGAITHGAKTEAGKLRDMWQQLRRRWPLLRITRTPRHVRVLETLQLGEKRQLLVISVDGRKLLLGVAANFLATLAELERNAEEAQGERERE